MKIIDGHKLIENLRKYRHEVVSVDGLEALIDQMPSAEPECNLDEWCHDCNRTALEEAQPERKRGKWIRWYEELDSSSCTEYIPHCKCSECGTDINARSTLFIKFCPYCGAKMDQEERK